MTKRLINPTQTKRNDEAFKEYQNMLHTLAHDLRNPLSGIRGFADLLEKDLADQPDLQRLASMIIKGADNLNELITKALQQIDSKKE